MIFTPAVLIIVLLNASDQLITNLENIRCKHRSTKYSSNQEAPLLCTLPPIELIKSLNKRIENLLSSDPELYFRFQEVLVAIGSNKYCSVKDLISVFYNLCDTCRTICNKFSIKNEAITGVIPEKSSMNNVEIELMSERSFKIKFLNKINSLFTNLSESVAFIDCISKLWNIILREERQPTPDEFLAIQLAYYVLSIDPLSHVILGLRYKSIGLPGFRADFQTYMALTDPGEGHIFGTTRNLRWMQGVYVHTEHLERPKHLPRLDIESYRVPSFTNFVKVRLHTGSVMPNTFYIGRILQDSGNFDRDLLKVVRTTVCAVNEAFSIGSAECKISMDKLSTFEAAMFMRSLKAEVVKKDDQVLSAAWNLNYELIDDLQVNDFGGLTRKKSGHVLVDRYEIAKEAIIITFIGGFEKLTWDGASDKYPSQCIVPYQISLEQALTLVHHAHSLGLLTYLSAGFKFDEIKVGVLSGVDGIGIGGAQILRNMDETTGYHGPYLEENIDGILQKRNEASQCDYGKAVQRLCRLDTMYHEGTLTHDENTLRENLFNELHTRFSKFKQDSHIREYEILLFEKNKPLMEIMDKSNEIEQIQIDDNQSNGFLVAHRVFRTKNPMLSYYAESDEDWYKIKDELHFLIEKKDKAIDTFYNQSPWKDLFLKHKQKVFDAVLKNLSTSSQKTYNYTGLIRGKAY